MQEVAPEQINLRTGIVKQQIGSDHYLLEFTGANYRFSNVFHASRLTQFVFFNTTAERDAFLAELQEQRAQSKIPAGVTLDPPPPAPAAGAPEAPGL
jgi:hypothetical protein